MSDLEQIELFESKARQHENCARIAAAPDVVLFHDQLAAHYRRLASEVGGMTMPPPRAAREVH